MRVSALLVLSACGGASVTTGMAPMEPTPPHVMAHHHEAPSHADDTSKIYVEVTSDGEHGDVLRKSATAGLGTVAYAVSVEDGGDVELHVELATLTPGKDTACHVKIFVMRLPQHDLLAIADGSAHATGTSQTDTCLSTIGTAIVRQKIPVLLQRQLDAKN